MMDIPRLERRMQAQPVNGFALRIADQYLIFRPYRDRWKLVRIGADPVYDLIGSLAEISHAAAMKSRDAAAQSDLIKPRS